MRASETEVVIYGSTPSGICTAVRCARNGLSVALITHSHYLGGMWANGLASWDSLLYDPGRSPLVNEFVDRLDEFYSEQYGEGSEQHSTFREFLSPEPSAARFVIEEMIAAESLIEVTRRVYLAAVSRNQSELLSVEVRSFDGGEHSIFNAKHFVDASYEGDLMAAAGVDHRIGREARGEFDEPHAGRLFTRLNAQEMESRGYPRSARTGELNLRPFQLVSQEIFSGSTGEGDDAVQAYNFRIILSREPENRRLPSRPDTYDRGLYAAMLLPDGSPETYGSPLKSHWLYSDIADFHWRNHRPIPNQKVTWNHGNYVGANHGYAAGNWSERAEISQQHREFEEGLLYFLQNDSAVPEGVRAKASQLGYALDEFIDNDNFPYELYVREARRMVGRYVFSEQDASVADGLGRTPIHDDSIAFSDWPMDSHECRRERQLGSGHDGMVLLSEATRPAQIPLRVVLPQRIDNLVVSWCVSATHIGWGTLRVEPAMMQLGEAIAVAITVAARSDTRIGRINVNTVQRELVENGLALSFMNDVVADGPFAKEAQFFTTYGFFSDYNAELDRPLGIGTAATWIEGIASRRDPNVTARSLPGGKAEEPATQSSFGELLQRWGLKGDVALTASETVSRGEGCKILYGILAAGS